MWINVSKEHIKNGAPQDECNCPIALAVQEAAEMELGDDVEIEKANIIVTVHDDDINVCYHKSDGEMEFMYSVSPEDKDEWSVISDFISNFDNGHDVEPFEMAMEINN